MRYQYDDPQPLSVSERKGLLEQVGEIERQISRTDSGQNFNDTEFRGDKLEDSGQLKARAIQLKQVLERDSCSRVSGPERIKVERELRVLEDRLRPLMVSDRAQRISEKDPGFDRVVAAQLRVLQHTQELKRWQKLRRRLDPSDSTVSNVDLHLRPRI